MKKIYLDNTATTPLDERVLNEMIPFFVEKFYNPSSIYLSGNEIRKHVENARKKIADFINALPEEIIFTSGGTEANNLAIKGIAFKKGKGHIITSKIEHLSVLDTIKYLEKKGFEVTYVDVDEYGIVDPGDVRKAIRNDTILISIIFANNEVGTIQDIREIARIAKEKGIPFHTDGVMMVGWEKVDVKELGVDMLSFSAHKFHGPKGIGALYVRKGILLENLIHGGLQEKKRRGGTENVAGIIGFGKICEIRKEEMEKDKEKIKKLRDDLENFIKENIPEVLILGHPLKKLYNISSVCFKYIEGESILLNLDFEGICVSSGSACTSGSLEPSHVLLAMGIPHEIAHGNIRFSFGKFNEESEVERVKEVLPKVINKLRQMSPFWEKK